MENEGPSKNITIAGLVLFVIFGGYYFYLSRIKPDEPSSFAFWLRTDKPVVECIPPLEITASSSPQSLVWDRKIEAAAWPARDAHAMFAFNDKLWIIGGLDGSAVSRGTNVQYWEAPHFNDIWVSANGCDWKLAGRTPWPGRRSLSVVEFNGALYMLGGWAPEGGYKNDIWTSKDGTRWKKIVERAEWPGREGQVVVAFNNKLWLVGGVHFDKREAKNDVWSSADGISWTQEPTPPFAPRYDHDLEVFNGKLWLSGGVVLGGRGFAEEWVSEDGKNWSLVSAEAPFGYRHGHIMIAHRNLLWIVGGWDTVSDRGSSESWYSADGVLWQKTGEDGPWMGREDHAVVEFKNRLWLTGGMSGTKDEVRWTNDVWVLMF